MILFLDTVLFAGFIISVDGADVEAEVLATTGHRPGVHGGVIAEVMGQIAGGIFPAAIGYRAADKIEVLSEVDVEWRDGPCGLGLMRFLLHIQNPVVIVQDHHSRALELCQFRLLMADNAARILLPGELHEVSK